MNVIIIDDESQSREVLVGLLKLYCPEAKIIGIAENGLDGLELIRSLHPDLIFLDIEMPGMDGIQVVRQLEHPDQNIIFVTAHNQYAVQAFEMSAVDYLLKPVSGERLIQAVHKANIQHQSKIKQKQYELLLELIHQQNNPTTFDSRIAFSMMNEIVFSWIRNIIWIEAKTNMSFVKLSDHSKELYIAKSIGEYVKMLSKIPDLKLVHRSHLVNRNYVKRFLREENSIELSDGKHVPVSIERKNEVMEWLGVRP
ncbi:MAG: response regulator transcription factor [Saprospiraceae bacterium]|nr:response regulator transcription factor [Saprospiraceae bacterium]